MVTKPTQTAGIAISNCRVIGNGQIAIQFINSTAAAVTPVAENYAIACLNDIPAVSNVINMGVVATGIALIGANTSAEQGIAANGVLATDVMIGVSKPVLDAGAGVANARVSAANLLGISLGNYTAGNITPAATEIWGVSVFRQNPEPPVKIFRPILSPASVAANTTAEQVFAVAGIPAGSTITVNKPAVQVGLGISGFRVTGAGTIGITFENVTAAAITPTALEQYKVACFMAVGVSGGVPGSWVALSVPQTNQRVYEQALDLQATLVNEGIANGA